MRRFPDSSHPTNLNTKMKVLTSVTSEPEADLIRLRLSQMGIPSVARRTIGGPEWGASGARDIFVNEQDLQRAHEVLDVQEEGGGIVSSASEAPARRAPELLGQTVVVLGGSAGIGLETARRARAEGASVILTGRDRTRLDRAALELDALSSATFDVNDPASLSRFFAGLLEPIDHVMVTAGRPHYGSLLETDLAQARQALDEHLMLVLQVARNAAEKMRPGGTLLFMVGAGARRIHVGLGFESTVTAAVPALTASLALELAPVRVNAIAAGFVDTPLSASLLGSELENRRDQLRATLPIGRVVGPDDVAALAVHVMINTALTGSTYDVDGGEQLVQ